MGYGTDSGTLKIGTGGTDAAAGNKGVSNGDSHTHEAGSGGATVPVAGGGTGATTAAAARTNLGVSARSLIISPLAGTAPQTGSFDERYLFDGSANHLDGRENGVDLTRVGNERLGLANNLIGEGFHDTGTYLWKSGAGPTALHNIGAMTVQMICSISTSASVQTFFCTGKAGAESEADNTWGFPHIYLGRMLWFQESGAGVNGSYTFEAQAPVGELVLLTWTRSADDGGSQTLTFYVNGTEMDSGSITTATGGTAADANFWIGVYMDITYPLGPGAIVVEYRQIAAEYSAANVAADYALTLV